MGYDSERLIPKILDLYYVEELSQEAIARQLGISRATVARNLAKAKELGYVKITLSYPDEKTICLEKELKEKYHLLDILIANGDNEQNNVSTQAASYLARTLRNDMTLGITWGTSVKDVIENLPQQLGNPLKDYSDIKIVPLIGTVTPQNTNDPEKRLASSNFLAIRAGEILNAVSYSLPAPMFVSRGAVKAVLEKEPPIADVLRMARKSDLILLGIGTVDSCSTLGKVGGYTEQDYSRFREQGAVGEIVGRMYDNNGEYLDFGYGDRIIGISLEEIQRVPIRIAVAYGEDKREAIRSALRSGIVNVLVTDLETAEQL